jgi:hypothetical protein
MELFNKEKNELVMYPAGKMNPIYIIPDNIIKICNDAFLHNYFLKTILINKNVKIIEECALGFFTELEEFIVSEENNCFSSRDGILFNKDKTELIHYPPGKPDISYTVPDYVKSIAVMAFAACQSLNTIKIPYGIINIGGNAFNSCSNLININIPESISSINDGIFRSCSSLTSVFIHKNINYVSNWAFSNCDNLFTFS